MRLGHEVKHVGPQASLKDAWGVGVPEKYKWERSLLGYDWKPDLVILADSLTADYNVSRLFLDVPVIVWSNDNHVKDLRTLNYVGLVKHYFLAHYHGKAQPVTHDDETWLPCATDPIAFPPSQIPWEAREFDVCCIGVMYPRRDRLVRMLKDAGLKVFAATGLVYDEYRDAYQNSRIALCSSVNSDLAQRFFEGAGMGCLVLTDLVDDLVDDVTNKQLGLHGFAVYQSGDECVNRALEFLRQEPEITQAKQGATLLQSIVLAKHTWDSRAQVVVDWYEKEYGGKVEKIAGNNLVYFDKGLPQYLNEPNHTTYVQNGTTDKPKLPMLNLGCGKTHLPSAKPAGHEMVDEAIYDYPLWVNVDKVEGVGADKTFDLFAYPWPLEDNSYDGALLGHVVEHIPHEITRNEAIDLNIGNNLERMINLKRMQDGWYAFFSELYRVLTPGALILIVSPYGFSDSSITYLRHTYYTTMNTYTYAMSLEIGDGSKFKYNNGGINLVIEGQPIYRFTPYAKQIFEYHHEYFPLDMLVGMYNNIVYDFYVKLKVIK